MQDPQNYEKLFQFPNHILWSAINQTLENTLEGCASVIYGYTLVPEESVYFCCLLLSFLELLILGWNPAGYEHSEYQ